jgi:hypothetical protein
MELISFIYNSWMVLTSNVKMDQCCPQLRFFYFNGQALQLIINIFLLSILRRVDVRQAAGRKNNLSQHDERHVVPTPLSGIRVGK